MICYKSYNIEPSTFISNFDAVPKFPQDKQMHHCFGQAETFLNPIFYKKIQELGKIVCRCIFMKPHTDKGNIHIDNGRQTALNILLKGQGITKWFNPKDEPSVATWSHYHKFNAWYSNYGECIDSWTEGKVAVVRVDIPHNGWPDHEEREVVSIRWNSDPPFDKVVACLESYLDSLKV